MMNDQEDPDAEEAAEAEEVAEADADAIDWDQTKRDFAESLKEALGPLIGPENAEAMHAFVQRSSERAVLALSTGDTALYREIQAQARVMAEEQRVRLNAAKWDVFMAGVRGVFATALRVGMTAIG